jgi:branched-chain amino acid transport system ATP-binding protein
MLDLDGVFADYGTLEVLKDITLSVGGREVVTLLGPNGAGKTTLFRAISGQTRVMRGRITFQNHDLSRMTMWDIARLGIGYVPEGRQLFGALNVRDNLELAGVHSRRLSYGALPQHLAMAFSRFPVLGERQRQPAGTLSGGQQQMLAMARALMGRPQFLILDEPSLGLAPRVVQEVFRAIRAIHQDGVGVLLIEQNAAALGISDRVYVMERGRIVLSGRAADVARDNVQRLYLGVSGGSTSDRNRDVPVGQP